MTLEDFFTLTEMKDGLTAPGRVEELVTVMQKEKDYVVKNVGDATRQWSTVASTIAATENKECLDLFIQLDGLWFINRWLKDAQKFCNDSSGSFVEESITALLRALERLHIDNEKSVSTGIWITVKNLLGHNSSRVQDRARALFDSWKWVKDDDEVCPDIDKVGESNVDGTVVTGKFDGKNELPEVSATESKECGTEGNLGEPVRDEILPSRNLDGLQAEIVRDSQIETSKILVDTLITSDHAMDRTQDAQDPAAVSNHIQENLFKEEQLVIPAEGITSLETRSSPDLKQGSNEGKSDVQRLDECADDGKQSDTIKSSPECGVAMEILASCTMEAATLLSGNAADADRESVKDPSLQNKIDAKDGVKAVPHGDVSAVMSESKIGIDSNLSQSRRRSPEAQEITFSRTEDMIPVEEDKENDSDGDEDMVDASDYLKSIVNSKSTEVIDKRSDIEFEYGIDDALEVARQVAKAVEREVSDYREPSCSASTEKNSDALIKQPGSPESINGNDNKSSESSPKEMPAGPNISVEASPRREVLSSPDHPGNQLENCMNDIESSQVTEAAREAENPEKGLCNFDLNEEVCSEEMDRPVNSASAAISVVAASRAAAVPGLPSSPLQFEGTLGWKGSAATSAFRPASPRRIPDGDKISIGRSSSSPKQRRNVLEFDLNVAEDGDDKNLNLISGKHLPVSSGLPSGESSVEVSPRRSGRFNLDLNRTDDDGDAPPSDWRMERRLPFYHDGFRSPSPATSSSSMQPCVRNIDLNDRPSIHCDSSFDQQPYLSKLSTRYENAYGGLKPVDPVISLMGTRVEVNRKDYVPQSTSVSNGKAPETAMDSNLARAGGFLGIGPSVSYAHSSAYGYNGITTGPAMSISSLYGPGSSIPYMVDSRGAPVVPQIMGSAPVVPPYSQPHFIMSMTGTQAINGAGPSRHNFDLNSGFVIEGGNREAGSSRQLFIPGQGRLMEEHMRADSQPSSSSGIGGKRKEPEGGWEPYPFNLKHHQQPPWK